MSLSMYDLLSHPNSDLEELFQKYMHHQQMISLTGVGHFHNPAEVPFTCEDVECLGMDPFLAFEQEIEYLTLRYEQLKNHKHEWGYNHTCWCGWDGNV